MIVTMSGSNQILTLNIEVEDDDDVQPSPKYSLNEKKVTTHLPHQMDINSIHPDHLALAIIMIVNPFVGKRLILPKGISRDFFEKKSILSSKYDLSPVDENLKSWSPNQGSHPGLAFSAGVDSTAALSLMPVTTSLVFLDRPIIGKSLYNKDAVHTACLEISRLGYDLHMINCDLEYVRNPTGFPVDVANSVPLVLMAEFLNLDCIGFGTILESAYGIGHSEGRDYIRGSHFKFWGGLFDAAGLPFILPVAGISEVGTSIIVKNSPFGEYSQSCMRGEWKKPCLNCWKCFRKRILDWAIDGEKPSSEIILKLFNNKEALRFLSSIPIKHENVLTWATNRLEINNELFNLLKKRVMGDDNSLDYLDKWYSPSIEIIPKKYRKFVENKICCYLRVMDINDENEIRNWSLSAIIDQPETNSASEKLSNRMDIHIKSH